MGPSIVFLNLMTINVKNGAKDISTFYIRENSVLPGNLIVKGLESDTHFSFLHCRK
jgi:hypothetical protein